MSFSPGIFEALSYKTYDIIATVSPARRRWNSFLKSLSLNPDNLDRPIEASGKRDFIICGAPRTGTTLLAGMLFQPPGIVTVIEPWDGMRIAPAELFRSLRNEIGVSGRTSRNKLNIEELLENREVSRCLEGEGSSDYQVKDENFFLGVKWPAFWRFLEHLPDTRFFICLRNPIDTVNSFKKEGGRLGRGLEYDTAFNKKLNGELENVTFDPALRRILLYEKIYTNILPYVLSPNVKVVKFERWFHDPEKLIGELGAFLGVTLEKLPVLLREPEKKILLTEKEIELIHSKCTVARQYGYELGR